MPTTRELGSAPRLAPLFSKAMVTGFARRGDELPDTVYSQPGVLARPERLAAYDRVCGFRLTDELPATYPHVLSFPLQMKLMTDQDFPFPLAGLVHVANRIVQHRAPRVDEPVNLRVHVENLAPHPKGTTFDMVSAAVADGVVIWSGVSTYLSRTGGAGEEKPRGPDPVPAGEPTAVWQLPGDLGRRYAAVSGDRNPIHLYPLTARLFGFHRPIAHGMWTLARCLAAFEGRLPAAFTVEVRFRRPVPLPASVGFVAGVSDAGWRFDVVDTRTRRPHVEGTLVPG